MNSSSMIDFNCEISPKSKIDTAKLQDNFKIDIQKISGKCLSMLH